MHAPPALGSASSSVPCLPLAIPHVLNVLIVDSDSSQAHQLSRQLSLHAQFANATIKLSHHGLDALSVAEQLQPQLIIVEIGWPRRSGACTAKLLRARHWGKPAVMVSHIRSTSDSPTTDDFDFHFFDGFSDVLMAQIYPNLAKRRAMQLPEVRRRLA